MPARLPLAALVVAVAASAAYWLFVSPQGGVMSPPPVARWEAERARGLTSAPLSAYILGGTGGIGLSMAKDLLGRGFSVFVTGTSQASLDKALATLRPLVKTKAQRVEGEVTNMKRVDENHATIKRLLETRDLRVVVLLGFPEHEAYTPIYNMNPQTVKTVVDFMGRGMADPLTLALHDWVSKNKTGVFLGMSSGTAYIDMPACEVYTAGRSFHTCLLLSTGAFLHSNSRYANASTRNILVANAEIPLVLTPTLERVFERDPKVEPMLRPLAWNSDDYAKRVLHRALDLGHMNIVDGPGFRLARQLHKVMSMDFGDVDTTLFNENAYIVPM